MLFGGYDETIHVPLLQLLESLLALLAKDLPAEKDEQVRSYILTLTVAKICTQCFLATTNTAEQRCCEYDEILAIYRQCFEIYRWVRMYGWMSQVKSKIPIGQGREALWG